MIDNNTKQVNELLAKALSYCAIALVALLLINAFGIFDFSKFIRYTIIFVGVPATLLPTLLCKLNVSERFIKHFMMVSLSLVIGLLGSQNGIGIYITYILVPVASCLYFSYKFTAYISTLCYFIMMLAVYINTAGKLEVIYKGWSHSLTFRNYIIGFSLEYIITMIILNTLVKRAQLFLTTQQNNIRLQQEENDRQKKITDFYVNTFSIQRASAFNTLSKEMSSFSPEDFARMAAGHSFISSMQNLFKSSSSYHKAMNSALSSIGEYFNLERILYIEPEDHFETANRLSYSWSKREKYRLNNFYSKFNLDDYAVIAGEYDRVGYIELAPDGQGGTTTVEAIDCGLVRFISSIAIGTQLWMPTLSAGDYSGAICFERFGNAPFKPVDILLLSDIVSTLSIYVNAYNSQMASHAKSTFLSTMSHEIRTPMNAIIGMATVALREEMSAEVRKSLNIIKSSSEGLLTIINDILDFSKIESGRIEIIPEDYPIMNLLNDVKTIAEARNAEKGLKLSFNVPGDIPCKLNGDMVRIKQVMVNLATNAIKYTDEGSVDFNVTYEHTGDDTILLRYSVVDTGQGIREEDLDKLFSSFSQVNQEKNHHTEGTGLGLAISKQLIELMGGSIGVESVYNEGSTFSFVLPQKIVDASPAGSIENTDYDSADDSSEDDFTAPGSKILVVDDNEINRMVAESLLEIFEMDIELADGGTEALKLSSQTKYDIIFMDRFMPDLDGLETTKAIRSDDTNPNQHTPIVALTADALTGVKEEMLASGMDDFLAKPIDMNSCTQILKKYLAH